MEFTSEKLKRVSEPQCSLSDLGAVFLSGRHPEIFFPSGAS